MLKFFVHSLFLLAFIATLPAPAADESFSLSMPEPQLAPSVSTPSPGPVLGTEPAEPRDWLLELKRRAISQWLASHVGGQQAAVYLAALTDELADGFVADYSVSRSPGIVTLSGRLDGPALAKWVRRQFAATNQILRPVTVVTSSVPEMEFTAAQAGSSKPPVLAGLIQKNVRALWAHLKAVPVAIPSFEVSPPSVLALPEGIAKIRSELGAPSANLLLYLQWGVCKGCKGPRLDTFLVQLTKERVVFARTDEFSFSPNQAQRDADLKAALEPYFESLSKQVEEEVSQGGIAASEYTVRFENVLAPKAYRLVLQALSRAEFISLVKPTRIVDRVLEVRLLSGSTSEELQTQVERLAPEGMRLEKAGSSGLAFKCGYPGS